MLDFAPRIWDNATCAIFGGGPSMSREIAEKCVKLKTIAVNNCYQIAPWADVLYAADRRWWEWHPDATKFQGLKFTVMEPANKRIVGLKWKLREGLDEDPHYLATGRNSGYQAVNLAYHLGARIILLCGFNMQPVNGRDWWHPSHPQKNKPSIYDTYMKYWPSIVKPLEERGIKVYNTTPNSALTCFEHMNLDDFLKNL